MAKEDERVLTLIKRGGAIGGAATGSVVGFLAGGPIGAAVGGALGATLQTVATEIVNRELSRREEMRVGATASYAIDFIHERLERGDRPREDKFFLQEQSGSSPAQEIFEGVLVKAKADHEERKARFYGVLFANVAFDATCSRSEANYLLHLMDGPTFLQLALISLFSDTDRFPKLPVRVSSVIEISSLSCETARYKCSPMYGLEIANVDLQSFKADFSHRSVGERTII